MIRPSRKVHVATSAGILFLLGAMVLGAAARDPEYKETVIAGGPDKFAEVRHVILTGTNFEIGKQIGELAQRDGVQIKPTNNRILNRAKREYMASTYPVLYERMKGVAASFGLSVEDDSYDFTLLWQKQMTSPGCSAAFYPAEHTSLGHDILSKNYDWTTGDLTGRPPREGRPATMARPYLFEIHPDRGYPSLSLNDFEYLGGVLEGINSEGLVVSILGETESGNKVGREPGDEVGMHELMSMRYLLDNCRNVEEAKKALLSLKHYYAYIPCHYIVGDKSGKSFLFEFSPLRNRTYVIDGDGPQWVTNHLVFLHQKASEFPEGALSSSMRRYKTLDQAIRAKEKFTIEEIAGINKSVAIPPSAPESPEYAPIRTLWYAQYDLDDLTLAVKFYLGERPDPENGKGVILEYSPTKTFVLGR